MYGHEGNWRRPREWKEWVDAPGSQQMRLFREVVTGCEGWWEMEPDQGILAAGARSGFELNIAARSRVGRWLMVYVSEPGSVTVQLDAIRGAGKARGMWIDPRDGRGMSAGTYAARGVQEFASPKGWEDAVLLVEGA